MTPDLHPSIRFQPQPLLRWARTSITALLCALGTFLAPAALGDDPFLRRTATVRAAQDVGPAVVNITTERLVSTPVPFPGIFMDPRFQGFFRDFSPPQQTRTVHNLGSGVIFDEHGHVLTNAHVVMAADRVRATLADGREFDTTLIGADPHNDLAVLQIQTEEELPWIEPGSSEDLMVGEPVIAIGNPFGLSNTVTTGVISALDRSVRAQDGHFFHGFLQTDASINPGNSGGPLLNAEGKLIAINPAVYNGAQGIGFAIPIDVARRVVAELLEHGEVAPVWLGLQFQSLSPALREVMNLPDGMSGALVNGVRDDSPARRAGVVRGDIVTSFNGRPLRQARRFFEMLETATPGQQLVLSIWRTPDIIEVQVTVEEFPSSRVPALAESLLGTRLAGTARGGFTITQVRPESAAARIGLRPGDLLVALSGRALTDGDQLKRAVLGLRGQVRALIVVERAGQRYPLALPLI